MAIPAKLEDLVLCQKAFSKTISLGRSGQMVIPVHPDRVAVIWHFDYFNFVDFTDPTDLDEVRERSVHQVILRSTKSTNSFIIRDGLQVSRITGPGGEDINEVNISGYYSKDTYLVHENNIIVSISASPPAVGTIPAPGVAPNVLKPDSPPRGYGSDPATAILQTTNEVLAGASGEIIELSSEFGVSSLPTPYPVGSLKYPINLTTALNPTYAVTGEGQRSYPILNIDYVEINKQVAEKIFSSS